MRRIGSTGKRIVGPTRLGVAIQLVFASLVLAQPPRQLSSLPGQASVGQGNLPVGVYEVSFRLAIDRQADTVTPLATLAVHSEGYPYRISRVITPYNFDAANQPQEFRFVFDNFKTMGVQALVEWAQDKVPVPKLSVEKITIAPCDGPCIGTVWPGKILYRTREEAKGFVAVYNGAAQPQTVTLRCMLESDVDRVRPLKQESLTLAPGERREVPLTWNTGREEYGFALGATLLDADGRQISQGRQYFSVADNVWKVNIAENSRGSAVPYGPTANDSPVSAIQKSEEQLAAELAKPFVPAYWGYSNYQEFYAWSPDDFFHIVPDTDYWYSGVGNYMEGKRLLQLTAEWLHRRGMRAISYVYGNSNGYGADATYRKHPDWFVYDENGKLAWSGYEKQLEIGSTTGATGAETPMRLGNGAPASSLSPNIANLAAIDAQIDQIVKSQKMFGWDGIRMDTGAYWAFGYDFSGRKIVPNDDPRKKEELEALAWAHLRDSLWKRIGPHFVLGDNYGYETRDGHPPIWKELCKHGQLVMEEVPRSAWEPLSPRNRWHDFLTFYHENGDIVRRLGGHHLIIGLDNEYPVDHLYLNVATYAMRAHPYGYQYHSETLPLGNYAQFATRYSALIWDIDRVKPLPEADKKIVVKSAVPVWWQELACVRQAPGGRRQTIVHLINPPAQERIYSDPGNRVPPVVRDVQVALRTGPGEKVSRAWLLSADPVTHAESLPIVADRGQVSVKVPKLYFWSIVVFE